ncbi:MAG: thioredoxin [Deltaproteobacteria bacterium]
MAENVVEFSSDNFQQEVLESDVPVLVDFWAPWCAPCRMIAPAVEQLAGEFGEKAKVGKVNIDEHPSVAQTYGVMSIPTLLVFKGGQPVQQIVGAVAKGQIQSMVEKAM